MKASEMKFSECLDEYLELRESGPDEDDGFTDKRYYRRMDELNKRMDALTGSAKKEWYPNEKY